MDSYAFTHLFCTSAYRGSFSRLLPFMHLHRNWLFVRSPTQEQKIDSVQSRGAFHLPKGAGETLWRTDDVLIVNAKPTQRTEIRLPATTQPDEPIRVFTHMIEFDWFSHVPARPPSVSSHLNSRGESQLAGPFRFSSRPQLKILVFGPTRNVNIQLCTLERNAPRDDHPDAKQRDSNLVPWIPEPLPPAFRFREPESHGRLSESATL